MKSHAAYVVRALLSVRDALVGIRAKIENEIRGLLKILASCSEGRVGGFTRRAKEIVAGEFVASPEIKRIIEALLESRPAILDRIKVFDSRVRSVAKQSATARLFMTAPGVGIVSAAAVSSRRQRGSRPDIAALPRHHQRGNALWF